jgi:hypothetical protein
MEIPQTVPERIQWFQRRVGRRLVYRIEDLLIEFQSAVPGATVGGGANVKDVLVGGSFLESNTDRPADLDIGVVTDSKPGESVASGFWRFVNSQTVLDIPLPVDCVWIRSPTNILQAANRSRQYSVLAAEAVSPAEYPQSTFPQIQ